MAGPLDVLLVDTVFLRLSLLLTLLLLLLLFLPRASSLIISSHLVQWIFLPLDRVGGGGPSLQPQSAPMYSVTSIGAGSLVQAGGNFFDLVLVLVYLSFLSFSS